MSKATWLYPGYWVIVPCSVGKYQCLFGATTGLASSTFGTSWNILKISFLLSWLCSTLYGVSVNNNSVIILFVVSFFIGTTAVAILLTSTCSYRNEYSP